MKIGNLHIEECNDCPAFNWQGENITKGNLGWGCSFGNFSKKYDYQNVEIPSNCPLQKLTSSQWPKI